MEYTKISIFSLTEIGGGAKKFATAKWPEIVRKGNDYFIHSTCVCVVIVLMGCLNFVFESGVPMSLFWMGRFISHHYFILFPPAYAICERRLREVSNGLTSHRRNETAEQWNYYDCVSYLRLPIPISFPFHFIPSFLHSIPTHPSIQLAVWGAL